mgnify:CR=1 FL=1
MAANVAQKKLESQEEAIRKLQAKNQEYEGKVRAWPACISLGVTGSGLAKPTSTSPWP